MERITNYHPTIAIIGKSGSGKSTLLNALFEGANTKVSHVETGRAKLVKRTFETFTIFDFPGVSDVNETNEQQFIDLNKQKLQEVDLALWVLEANTRAYRRDIEFTETRYCRSVKECQPYLFSPRLMQ
ncbi:GTPase [Agarivorans sp. B2Z047]|uniref:GTPase n=1 Tax=Agarivorans sp. B2Z047 TaxID=2652721 RepID=UPI0034CEEF42